MDEKERIRKVAEKYAGELDKVLKDVSRELDHAAIKLEQVGGRVYDNLPKEGMMLILCPVASTAPAS